MNFDHFDYWKAITLYGLNVATYKPALATCLLKAARDEKTEILREQYKDFTIILTSSKDNINIDEIFDEGLQKAINNSVKFKDSEDPSPLNKLVLSTEVKRTTWKSYCNIL